MKKLHLYGGSLAAIVLGLMVASQSLPKKTFDEQSLQVLDQTGQLPFKQESNGVALFFGSVLTLSGLAGLGYTEFKHKDEETDNQSTVPLPVFVQPEVKTEVKTTVPEPSFEFPVLPAVEKKTEAIQPKVYTEEESLEMIGDIADDIINPKILSLLDVSTLWLVGSSGSGKTTKAEWVIENDLDDKYEVWFCSSHYKAGQLKHPNVKIFGAGQNYKEIEEQIKAFVAEMKRRLKRASEDEDYDPLEDEKPIRLVCEEMSGWSTEINGNVIRSLIKCCLQDIRQANGCALFVSHGRTLEMIGGSENLSGYKEAIFKRFAILESFAKPVPGSRPVKMIPSGEGLVKFVDETEDIRISISSKVQPEGRHFKTKSQLDQERKQRKAQLKSKEGNHVDRSLELEFAKRASQMDIDIEDDYWN